MMIISDIKWYIVTFLSSKDKSMVKDAQYGLASYTLESSYPLEDQVISLNLTM